MALLLEIPGRSDPLSLRINQANRLQEHKPEGNPSGLCSFLDLIITKTRVSAYQINGFSSLIPIPSSFSLLSRIPASLYRSASFFSRIVVPSSW